MTEALFILMIIIFLIFVAVVIWALVNFIWMGTSMWRIQYLKSRQERIYREETKPVLIVDQEAFTETPTEHFCEGCKYYEERMYEGRRYCHCGKKMRMELGPHGYAHPIFTLKQRMSRACEDFKERQENGRKDI